MTIFFFNVITQPFLGRFDLIFVCTFLCVCTPVIKKYHCRKAHLFTVLGVASIIFFVRILFFFFNHFFEFSETIFFLYGPWYELSLYDLPWFKLFCYMSCPGISFPDASIKSSRDLKLPDMPDSYTHIQI